MKILLSLAALILVAAYFFLSCNKESTSTTPSGVSQSPVNLPPIAKAGADVSFALSSCSQRVSLDLDGTGSSDPEGKSLTYFWRRLLGPQDFLILYYYLPKARVEQAAAGEYSFELSVKDAGGLFSKDTINISVKGTPKEYDLDMSLNSPFKFQDNAEDCYYGPPCHPLDDITYSDRTIIEGKGTFPPLGEFNIYFSEDADTAASKYARNSFISIYNGQNINSASIHGTSTVNLKKLIQQGGGPFTGSLTVTGGSATRCDAKVFNNLAPITITGSLDTTTRRVTFSIQGKSFF